MKSIKIKREYIVFGCLVFFHFFQFFSGNGRDTESLIPQWVSFPIEGAFMFYTIYYCVNFLRTKRQLGLYILVIIGMAFLMGRINAGPPANMTIMHDLLICLLILNGVVLLDFDEDLIIKLVKILAIVSCLFAIYSLLHFDISMLATLIAARGELWNQEVFFAITLLWMFIFLLVYSAVFKRSYLLAIIVWALAFILNAIATKRMFIVQTGLIILVLLYFYFKTSQVKNVRYLFWGAVIGVGIIGFTGGRMNLNIQDLITVQEERMTGETYGENNRVEESSNYLKNANSIDILVGKGLAIPHRGHPGNPTLTALHIGSTNLILKFGLFLLPVYLFYLIKAFKKAVNIDKYYRKDKWQAVCILTAVVQGPIMLFFANAWALTPSVAFFWYVLFRGDITKTGAIWGNDGAHKKIFKF